jgi:DNA invertase Pin-like site-specific DNA recombinase
LRSTGDRFVTGIAMARHRDSGQPTVPDAGGITRLTARQAEVLRLSAAGLSGKQIARCLGISPRTVEDHFSRMRQRTGARSDGELLTYGVATGIVVPRPARPARHEMGNEGTEELPQRGVGKRPVPNTPRGSRQNHGDGHQEVPEKGVENRECALTRPGPFPEQSPAVAIPPPRSGSLGAPGPSAPPGTLVGYARVSTAGQNLDRQIRALKEAGCIRVFADRQSGKTAARPELQACLEYLRPGDTLVVPSLDRLSRSLQDLITLVAGLRRRELGFRSLHEALDTTTPGGRLVFHVFAALAEFIRELIVQGTHEGIGAARARGVRLGRPPAMTDEQIRHARALLAQPDNTVSSIARLLGVSRSTIYKHVPELAGGPGQLSPCQIPPNWT